jgi:hypothetical protein
MIKTIDVDSTKAFTLYEACPEARCSDPLHAPASQFPPPTCPRCGGAGGRVPANAIKELAGHRHLTTTMRYMHLSPMAREGAIRLLDRGKVVARPGDTTVTA